MRHGLVLIVLAGIVWSGCTTAGKPTGPTQADERAVPPPVADQSAEPSAVEPAVVPKVSVEADYDGQAAVDTGGVEAFMRREAARCYRLALGRDPQASGATVYELMITTNGRVAGVERMSGDIAGEQLMRCLEGAMHQLRFDLPGDARAPAFGRLYLRLDFGREVLPGEPPVDAAPGS